ncbi:MAG: DUF4870 domain-containing protein [Cyanobacteria bacterium P01_F01_bin.116]
MSYVKKTVSGEVLLHLSLLLGWLVPIPFIDILLPVIIWRVARRQSTEIDYHARHAINWLISSTLYSIICLITLVGTMLLPVILGLRFVFPIVAAIQASKGKAWKYPLSFDFIGTIPENQLKRAAIGFLSLVIIPLASFLGSLAWYNQRSNWLATLVPASGTVIRVLEKADDGITSYQPVVEFKAQQEPYEVTPIGWSDHYISYGKGDAVEILYSSADPTDAILNDWFEKWFFVLFLLTLSGIFLTFSLIPSIFCWILSGFV